MCIVVYLLVWYRIGVLYVRVLCKTRRRVFDFSANKLTYLLLVLEKIISAFMGLHHLNPHKKVLGDLI